MGKRRQREFKDRDEVEDNVNDNGKEEYQAIKKRKMIKKMEKRTL